MPGSKIPIINSSALLDKKIGLCIFSLNAEIEDKIIRKNQEFTKKGGKFLSISPTSKYSIYAELKDKKEKEFKEISKEVYYSKNSIISINKENLQFFKDRAKHNERNRCRLCTHKNTEDKVHEMFIVHRKGTYIRPHKHLNKDESAHIIEGAGYLIIYDDQGRKIKIVELGDYVSHHNFYYRINGPYYHTQFITSDYFVFHETTNGPFKKSETVFAPWSPEEEDKEGIKKFMRNLEKSIKQKES